MPENTLDISWEAIIKVLVAGSVFYLLFLLREIVIWLFFAFIISILFDPLIDFFRKFRIPRILAVIISYLSILGILGFIIYLISPIFIYEVSQFSQNIPDYFERINPLLKSLGIEAAKSFDEFSLSLVNGLKESSKSIFEAIITFFGGVYSTFFIFTLAFFISLEESSMEKVLMVLTPKKYEEKVITLFERAQIKVAGWFAARLLTCFIVGAASFIVYFLFGIKFAFILALVAGLFNFIPYVGPTVTLILTTLFVGVSDSWLLALYIFIAILIIQEIENKFLTPVLLKRFMKIPPVLVLVSLLVGETLFGFLGMLFSVPIFGIAYEFIKEFLEKKKEGIE